jgi:2-hydroxychromene-2-carboxylate isomerase
MELSLPFMRPEPFPQNSLLAARIALIGLASGWGEAFCVEVFRAEFGEAGRIDDPATIADVLTRLDIAADPVLAVAQSDDNKARLRSQTEEARRHGIFGAPTFICADGEMFWGNDRLEHALLWAKGP